MDEFCRPDKRNNITPKTSIKHPFYVGLGKSDLMRELANQVNPGNESKTETET